MATRRAGNQEEDHLKTLLITQQMQEIRRSFPFWIMTLFGLWARVSVFYSSVLSLPNFFIRLCKRAFCCPHLLPNRAALAEALKGSEIQV